MMVNEKITRMYQLDKQQRTQDAANEEATLDGAIDDLLEEEEGKWKKKYF